MDNNALWTRALDKLKDKISYSNFKIFFENTSLGKLNDENGSYLAEIRTGNSFSKQNLEKKYINDINDCLSLLLGKKVSSFVVVGNVTGEKEIENEVKNQDASPSLFNQQVTEMVEKRNKNRSLELALVKSHLKKEYTFENFAVSPTNEVAYAGALAVAKEPGTAYNPLFLYGDVGVGKTHLMEAIGIRILQNNPGLKLTYSMGEQFTNEIIQAIRTKKTPEFRAKYREVDVLLIDDIQFIAGKNTVQEEFFHTFNAITSIGGQVVLTSDRPPHEIKLLEDRLRSRFEEGLTIDIQAPNFELRTAIVLIKSKQMGRELSMEVAQTIASHTTSTRKLQGVLSEIYAVSNFKNTDISPEFTLSIIKKQKFEPIPSQKNYVSPKDVVDVISKHFNVSPKLLYGPNRSRPIVEPRQYAMYLLKTDLRVSYVEIGRIFGGRDHSTVMHSVGKISKLVLHSEEMRNELSTLKKQIYG